MSISGKVIALSDLEFLLGPPRASSGVSPIKTVWKAGTPSFKKRKPRIGLPCFSNC
jgi:hypothetical protein